MAAPAQLPSDEPRLPPRPHQTAKLERSTRRSRRPGWAWIAGAIVLVLLVTATALIAPRWPYSEKTLLLALEQTFKVQVKIERFHRFYFPHPGCVAQNITLVRKGKHDAQPLVTLQKMVVTGRYSDFLYRPHHFAVIQLDGLQVRVPVGSQSAPPDDSAARRRTEATKLSIGTVATNGAVLEVGGADGKPPVKFEIHKLRVESIASGRAMTYQLSMGNPEPPGELSSQGAIGPWQSRKIGSIPLHGTVQLTDGKLDKYKGIGGTVQSHEDFSGTLGQMYISGDAAAPDFQVKSAHHPVSLTARFQLTLNALAGEVQLNDVTAKMGQTEAHVHGSIVKNPELGHRETSLDFAIERGRAQDLLWLFNDDARPPMNGLAAFAGHVRVPQYSSPFLQNVDLRGHFEISHGRFLQSTQANTNKLSARAQGKKVKTAADAPEVEVQDLASDVALEGAVAHFSNLDFRVPGADARMHGTYVFRTHTVDLHGDLRTEAPISKASFGIKAILLKPLDPLFRKKHAGAQVPVLMDGPISHPHFAVEIPKK